MKIIKTICAVFLAFTLSACSNESENISTVEIHDEEEVWKYDGSQTISADRKEESVTVQADASGNPLETTVNTTLSGIDSTSVIQDETDLSDIKNKNGDEQFECKDQTIYWQNLGNDISYSGISKNELPVKVQVKYYLNDAQLTPEEIAGKSGKVKIRFEYTNETEYEDIHVPFVCMSALMLDTDRFTNIEVVNGEVSSMDNSAVVIGYAFPGLKEDLDLASFEDLEVIDIPDYVEIQADAEDFSLDFTETIITTGMFSKIDDEDLDDLSDMSENMLDLSDAGNDLQEGADQLSFGFEEIQTAIIAYLDGMSEVSSGITSLSSGSRELSNGVGTIAGYVNTISDALNSVSLDDASTNEIINTIQADLTTVYSTVQNISSLSESFSQLTASLNDILSANTSLSDAEKQKIISDFQSTQAYTDLSSALSSLQEQLSSSLSDIQTQIETIDISSIDDIKSDFQKLQQFAKGISDGVTSLQEGMVALDEGIAQLDQGMQEAVKNNETIKDALSQYQSGLSAFSDGISKLNKEGLEKLSQSLGKDGSKLISLMTKLKDADASYQTFTKLNEKQEGSVIFMIETDGIH